MFAVSHKFLLRVKQVSTWGSHFIYQINSTSYTYLQMKKRDSLHIILILFTVGKYTVTFHVACHDLFFPRVSKATKENENMQVSKTPLRSSSSVVELDRLHSKKIKKHINGLRRAVSSTSIGTSRNFAPRSS